jgi:transcriptional regulator with XRE-family HTH domain
MNIGLKIKDLATQRKVSVFELSEKTGKSRQTIYDIFEKPHVNTEILVVLSEFFDVPITYFLTDAPDDALPALTVGKETAPALDVEKLRLKKLLSKERKKNAELTTAVMNLSKH